MILLPMQDAVARLIALNAINSLSTNTAQWHWSLVTTHSTDSSDSTQAITA